MNRVKEIAKIAGFGREKPKEEEKKIVPQPKKIEPDAPATNSKPMTIFDILRNAGGLDFMYDFVGDKNCKIISSGNTGGRKAQSLNEMTNDLEEREQNRIPEFLKVTPTCSYQGGTKKSFCLFPAEYPT